jgi:3-oxoacyl-[acyl-carrier-protein] synthase II
MANKKRRVVITGMGSVTPLGLSVEETWKNLLAGKSGISPIHIFDARTFPTTFAAQVRDFDVGAYVKDARVYEKVGRNIRFTMAAGRMAMEDSRLLGTAYDPVRFGIYLGSGEGVLDFMTLATGIAQGTGDDGEVSTQEFAKFGFPRYDPLCEIEQEPNMAANHLAAEYGIQGPALSCLTACAASTQAIGEAMHMVRSGRVDLLLAGGTHSMIHPLGVTGFNLLTALSTDHKDEPWRASRPFDRDRGGFVLGEGSTIMVLEELEHARARGAHILAELTGFGISSDAYRMTDIHPQGRGPAAAMRMALADAGAAPTDIHYISAHGTGTTENDKVETLAVKLVFGEQAYKIPISSVKSSLGHLIAAAGATELMTCVMAIRDQIVPPTMNLENPDPECDLDYVPNAARACRVEVCLSNSFGFGGQNDSLVIRRFVA